MGHSGKQFDKQTTMPDIFVSTAKERDTVLALQAYLQPVIASCYPEIDALVDAIESHGLPVLANGPEMHLKLSMMMLGVRPGVISADHPRYEDFVKSVIQYFPDKADCDFSRGMLLVMQESYDFTVLAYEFYHWMAAERGLPGYTPTDRKVYQVYSQKLGGHLTQKFLDKLGMRDAVGLRSAIRREKEALQFLRVLLHEVFIPINNSKRMEAGDAQA